jgi:O-acetyl-ADP-ribose deacetylase (regulator of RNase III)
MITYIKGDLLTTEAKILVHGCNAQGVMGNGVAKTIKRKYPKAYDDYYAFWQKWVANDADTTNMLGRIVPSVQSDGKTIINAITQLQYGKSGAKFVSYDAIDSCMAFLNYELKFKDWASGELKTSQTYIAMPKLGAGLGGGEWSIIEAIIEYRLKDHTVLVYSLD